MAAARFIQVGWQDARSRHASHTRGSDRHEASRHCRPGRQTSGDRSSGDQMAQLFRREVTGARRSCVAPHATGSDERRRSQRTVELMAAAGFRPHGARVFDAPPGAGVSKLLHDRTEVVSVCRSVRIRAQLVTGQTGTKRPWHE